MITPEGAPILTAEAMRRAEATAIAAGASVDGLMARAGAGVAEWVRRLAGDHAILVLCGPGNNGGDGYVAACALKASGCRVRIAASGDPGSAAASRARQGWDGPVAALADAGPAPVVVDALFGTGLSRPLDPVLSARLGALVAAASLAIAVDVPSGLASDDGAMLGDVPCFDVTLALGAAKPSHLLQPAARHVGALRVVDIGVPGDDRWSIIARPDLALPGPEAHKYNRGMVAVCAGSMPGAALLAATAALRAGAGYALVLGGAGGGPLAIVHKPFVAASLADPRIGAILIGPGLGRDAIARARLDAVLALDRPTVIDGDALHLIDPARLAGRQSATILTPHGGEFDAAFGTNEGSKIERALAAAAAAGAVIVFKGADTVVAAPDGRVGIALPASSWLSTAGTGDVLAGGIAALLAGGAAPFDAACGGVWLHGEAARRCGGAFIADDLASALSHVRGG
ncbi:MAG: bifunctional ADP-dependent NAD(P)H-hydrate dehydratase/NAD(P)H-hydrate epimerase [Sphingomonas sp. 28-66-16]|nr:MAG: bifunctional ADP-dependent NAD(P)H-hydrate dehydratase/NAD(P)H-hydrate epimerase [Sphingomonas sp. 28-66-16]